MMRKGLFILIAISLVCAGVQAFATPITLENEYVKFKIDKKGVVDAELVSGCGDTLDLYAFAVHYNYLGTQKTVWLGDKRTKYLGEKKTWVPGYGYHKKYRFRTGWKAVSGSDKVSISLTADYMLLPKKTYLDIRYSVYSKGPLSDVVGYLYLNPNQPPAVGNTSVETAGQSAWMMINDTKGVWDGGAAWPSINRILSATTAGGEIGFCARVHDDDYMVGNKSEVHDLINEGKPLPNTIDNQNPPIALAIKIPTTPRTVDVPPTFYVESRLEIVPEPCTMGLMLTGLLGLGALRRRQRR
jgi:hypothetical protein